MSGIRKTETVTCPNCGTHGTVGLGMAMIGARSDYREFSCAVCHGAVPFYASRAIVEIAWPQAMVNQQNAGSALAK